MKRRTVLIGGGALALAGIGTWAARPEEMGAMHDGYFNGLAAALKRAGLGKPVLVVDRQRLEANIAAIRRSTDAAKLPLRVVAKSLPAPQLLDTIMRGMGTQRLMVFSADMLRQLLPLHPGADYLGGKPLPVSEFVRVVSDPATDPGPRMQWLIDTPQRLSQYAEAAKARGMPLRVNLEIDVGLHRGGFADGTALAEALALARAAGVEVAGLMGYEPHVPKMPDADAAWADAQGAYAKAIAVLKAAGYDPARLTLNSAGSPTFRRHCRGTVANEVSVGSAFVKPGDFDYGDLADLVPAAFIATPVLKKTGPIRLPGLDEKSRIFSWWDPNQRETFFVHGGWWRADYESPRGLQFNALFGHSANQEIVNASPAVGLGVGDQVFLRPQISESVLLEFGDLLAVRGGRIVDAWPVYTQTG